MTKTPSFYTYKLLLGSDDYSDLSALNSCIKFSEKNDVSIFTVMRI